MKIEFEKLNKLAVIPKIANKGDAGADLTATSIDINNNTKIISYGTSIAVKIPYGYVGLLFPRSSVYKKNLTMANSVGVIDSGYRGEIIVKFKADMIGLDNYYEVGERIGQLVIVPIPNVEYVEVEDLGKSERGNGGFGSSGK